MITRVSPSEIRIGMYIHAFEGRWSDWPFWQSGFVLSTQQDLERLLKSSVTAVLVDTSKGIAPARQPAKRVEGRVARSPRKLDALAAHASQTIQRARRAVLRLADDVRLGRAIEVAQLAPLVADLAEEVENNSAAILGLLRIKSRDQYTYLHSVAVAALMMNLGRAMGIDAALLPEYGLAGLLHDVGKIVIPEAILNKPGSLTDHEFAIMRSHPERGHRLLERGIGVPALALDVCLHHHERPDGRGYPERLTADTLSVAARMGAICDVYDALTSDRAYKDAWSPQKALASMQRWDGQFDRAILHDFVKSLGIYPVGSLVRVRDSSLAIVIADNDEDPTCPTVRSFYSIGARARVRSEDIAIKVSSVLTLEDPAKWNLGDWPALVDELLERDDETRTMPARTAGMTGA